MRALVVGASGHIGAHLVRELAREHVEVRALVRPTSDVRGLAGVSVEVVHGDVLDASSLATAMRGCDTLFHMAAPTTVTSGILDTIIIGTRLALEQARRAGLQRVVYTSSVVAVGYSPSTDIVLDESHREKCCATLYHQAKAEAEDLVLEFGRRTGLPIIIVNPATVVGPLDYRVTPGSRPIQQCIDRGLPFAFDSGLTVVHAQDVARGHWQAMVRGRPGERYILGGERITIPKYFSLISSLCGRPAPRLKIPRLAMVILGACFSAAQGLGIRNVPFTFKQSRILVGRYAWYSSSKATNEIGYSWRPVEESVKSYIDWVKSGRPSVP